MCLIDCDLKADYEILIILDTVHRTRVKPKLIYSYWLIIVMCEISGGARPCLCDRTKAPFIATQLNSTGRPVELICVAINGALNKCYVLRMRFTHAHTHAHVV